MTLRVLFSIYLSGGFPHSSVVKNPPANAGDTGSIPDPGRFHVPQSSYAGAPQLLKLPSRAWGATIPESTHCNH